MKKFLVVAFLGFLFFPVRNTYSQNSSAVDRSLKFFNLTEAGFSIGLGNFKTDVVNGIQQSVRNDELVFTIQTINGVKYINKFGIGVSAGVEIWKDALLWPICAYIGYDFKPAENTVFTNLLIGRSFGSRDSTSFYNKGNGAFTLSFGIGYKMKLSKKIRFAYEVFYKYQTLESSYNNILMEDDNLITTRSVEYTVPLHFIGFRLGISFP